MPDTTLHKDESEMDIDDVMSSFERDVLGGGDKDRHDEGSGGISETSFKGGEFKDRKIEHGVIEVDWEGSSETSETIKQGVEREGTQGAHDNTSVSDANIKPLYISSYLSISSKLSKIPISCKLTFHPIPTVYKPPFPVAIPRKAIATSRDGGLAIVKRIPVCNPFQPDFFSPNDKKAGCTVDLEFFKCNSTYSISFDLMRKCRVCRFDHNVFPKQNTGVLIIGDSYTPPIVGDFNRCIPVFRLNNPCFEDCATSLKYILRNRSDQNGKPLQVLDLLLSLIHPYLGLWDRINI